MTERFRHHRTIASQFVTLVVPEEGIFFCFLYRSLFQSFLLAIHKFLGLVCLHMLHGFMIELVSSLFPVQLSDVEPLMLNSKHEWSLTLLQHRLV